MSMLNVQAIVIRAVMEKEYRELFFNDRTRALEGYDLTDQETIWLQGLNRTEFETFASEIHSSLIQGGNGSPMVQRL